MIKEDPTSIRYLDKLSEEEYEEIYKYFENELKDVYENIKFFTRVYIAKSPYETDYLYNKAEKFCIESLRLSNELLKNLRKQVDSNSIK